MKSTNCPQWRSSPFFRRVWAAAGWSLALLLAFGPVGSAQKADAPGAAKSSEAAQEDEIVDIAAERMDEDVKAGTTTFEGNVQITRESGYLYGDKVILYRDIEGKDTRVQRTVAQGNVRLKDGDLFATCETAEFREGNNIIDLKGTKTNPAVVLQGEDRYEANHFIYDCQTGRRTATGGVKFRVRVKRSTEETAPATAGPEATPGSSESSEKPSSSTDSK